ncbi:MAG: tRNA (uridine(54)-C5)-methyltransferase TrmA [Luminiphilus sp.]|nr:tRNA (uridine(54)-C5)-methyltransferase TrmA [Luminiphilus sp.]
MLPHQYQPDDYLRLLDTKIQRVLGAFKELGAPDPSIFESRTSGFRMRAEFRIWHDGNDLNYVMFNKGEPATPVVIESFPIAHSSIQQLLPMLKGRLKDTPELRRRLFQVEFLTTTKGQTLITLIYHRPLDAVWETEATSLSRELGFSIIGRSRGQKVVIGDDFVAEELQVADKRYRFKQPEQAFTQPNAVINCAMLGWVLDTQNPNREDLLELYCGVGNFTIPLSQRFQSVLATEVSKVATRAAIDNLASNEVSNVEFARLSAEEMGTALRGERPFRRLQQLSKPLERYSFSTIFVDPPRAGLDQETLSLCQEFSEILYISCNPMTLLDNLNQLTATHEITRFALFDQFPYTDHLECGVQLMKKEPD